ANIPATTRGLSCPRRIEIISEGPQGTDRRGGVPGLESEVLQPNWRGGFRPCEAIPNPFATSVALAARIEDGLIGRRNNGLTYARNVRTISLWSSSGMKRAKPESTFAGTGSAYPRRFRSLTIHTPSR